MRPEPARLRLSGQCFLPVCPLGRPGRRCSSRPVVPAPVDRSPFSPPRSPNSPSPGRRLPATGPARSRLARRVPALDPRLVPAARQNPRPGCGKPRPGGDNAARYVRSRRWAARDPWFGLELAGDWSETGRQPGPTPATGVRHVGRLAGRPPGHRRVPARRCRPGTRSAGTAAQSPPGTGSIQPPVASITGPGTRPARLDVRYVRTGASSPDQ